ncbi:MAG: FlgD immunoglobulin-like domain containing protein [Rariglobus sp.]
MNSRIVTCLGISLACLAITGCSAEKRVPSNVVASETAPSWPDDLVSVSNAASPEVSYAVKRDRDALLLVVEAASFNAKGDDVAVQAGLAVGERDVRLDASRAEVERGEGRARFRFRIPVVDLTASAEALTGLRVAFAVEWADGSGGQARQRERFLHTTRGATHGGLSANIADWQPLDLVEFERTSADRAREIRIDFNQPLDGKATVVIEDASGKRIRNLVSGRSLDQGRHRLVWDGLDESGTIAPPGDYRWRAISHPGLSPVHQFDFVNAPGSNHGTFHAAATNGNRVVLGTPVSEGGHQVVVLEKDGTFVSGFNAPHGIGLGRIAVAADARYVYAAYDGSSWGSKIERTKPDWKAEMKINLVRFDTESGRVADYSPKNRTPELLTYEVGPGSPGAREDRLSLRGLVLLKDKLYLAESFGDRVLEIDPVKGTTTRSFPLAQVTAVAARGDTLLAIVDTNRLVSVDPASGATTALATLEGKPAGLATDANGRIYVSDAADQVVRVLDRDARPVAVIGTPGGIQPGPYDPQRLQNPAGLTVCDGLVWVTEQGRWQPKRFAAYDAGTGRMAKEYFGPTNYGAQGAGFDPEDHTRWIGQGTLFDLDFSKHTATPRNITGGEDGRRHTFWRQDGRTFIITSGKATYIQELRADGTFKPLALLSSAHQFAYANNWKPPAAFLEAFTRDYPEVKVVVGLRGGIQRVQPSHGYGMLWVDRDGDGAMQAAEIEFSTAAENLGGSGWSHDFHDLTMRVPATVDKRKVLVTLKPEGWWPGGAPKYPALNDAARAGLPIDLPGSNQVESAVDRFGNTILNSSPDMRAFAPDGRTLWTYANKWSGVHGSHNAPLPSPGEMQGVLFFSGVAPLDYKADVMFMNGNHGRGFVMTTDGLYLDEMFPDVRLMTNPQAGGVGILGGECFGGTFGHSAKDGNYYFQGGGIIYRIYRIDGLRDTRRSEGKLTVNADQAAAAERAVLRRTAAATTTRSGVVAWREKPPVVDGRDNDWSGEPTARWDREGRFAVTARLGLDGETLYLDYTVRDDSPWVNNGGDWQALFKTGDGIDLQLGTDPAANPARSGPVMGDLRLFIAPMGKENVVVLYRHRVPGAKEGDGVVFQSPWRSERVDVVRRLDAARVGVERQANQYRVEVAVPLAELGLDVAAGKTLRGDIGVIYGDAAGTTNIYRNYWSNQSTGLVNDVPGEIMLTPAAWGELNFGASVKATVTQETTK